MKSGIRKNILKVIKSSPRIGGLLVFPIIFISKLQCSRFVVFRWLGKLLVFPIYIYLKDDYYRLVTFAKKIKLEQKRFYGYSRFAPQNVVLRVLMHDASVTEKEYNDYLSTVFYDPETQYEWSRRLIEAGRLDLARIGFISLLNRKHDQAKQTVQLTLLRQLGAICFMLGNNAEANEYWGQAGKLKRALFKPTTPKNYRILGPAWFAAYGHVAILDYYLKFRKLYPLENFRVVAQIDRESTVGLELLDMFAKMGVVVVKPTHGLTKDYNMWARTNGAPSWETLTETERTAMIDDFWEYDFPDGKVLGYAHAAARIQKEWEAAKLPPLFILNEQEKSWIRDYLSNLNIPNDAWYVCLHVREAGFHKHWNSLYPTMRDSEIDDYKEAIEEIVNAGGWVIRMGDPTMKPLPPMKNVVDYAHSAVKTAMGDILLVAGCRFFLGTNSGYATIGANYSIPCVLTNWVPLGWPLWPSQDLMMPKLFRYKETGQLLTLSEVFTRRLAFIQNWKDLPSDVELVANSPADLVLAVREMMMPPQCSQRAQAARDHYAMLVQQHDAFTGSCLSQLFIEKYPEVFIPADALSFGRAAPGEQETNDVAPTLCAVN